jgi:hypothetical protein
MSSSWLDQSSNANCFKQTYIQGFLDICGNIIIRSNGNLTVGGNTNISGTITCGNNIQPYYKYLFQTSDIKQNYNIIQIIPTSDFFTSNNITISNNYGNLSFKNGNYSASSSSYYNTDNSYNAYNAFNGSINKYWQSATNYTSTIYTGNSITNDVSGDWIQINLPDLGKKIKLTSFSIYCLTPNNAPNEFYLFGSSNSNIWTKLYSNSSSSSNPFLSNSLQTYIVSSMQPYLVFRLVIKSIYNTSPLQSAIINQLNLYGIPYNSGSNENSIYSNNFWFNYGSSTYDLLDSSSVSVSTVNIVSGLGNSLYINNFNYLSLATINLSNTNSFSILFWIKINNNQTSTIYEFNSSSNSIKLEYDNTNNANKLNLIIVGLTKNQSQSITTFDISNWCHIGIIHFANYVNIYINGIIFQTINNLSFTPDNYVINYIGRSKYSYSPHNSNFYMSDFRTYQFSLNAFQINSIYKVTDILTVSNSLSYYFKDTYFGSNVNIYNDLSLNGNINITSGNILTDISNTGNIFTTNTGIINIGTASTNIFVGASAGKTTIRNDVSMNGNVFVNRDLSLNGNFNITSGNIFTAASTANIFTTTLNSGIINIGTNSENIFVAASTGGKTTIRNDVSMNRNVFINRDLSLNGNFNITSGNIFTAASTANIFTTNADIINIGTISTNMFIGASTGKTTIRNDVSMNGNVFVNRDLSLNGNFNITSGNIFTNASTANIFTTTPNTGIINVGTNSENIFVGASTGKTTIRNDVSMNGNVFINRDLSLNGNFNITSGNIFTGASTANIFTTNPGVINIGTTSTNIFVGASTGKTTIHNDVSMNGNVSIIGDVSMNNNLYVKGNCNMNTNCNITGNCIIGKIYTNTINGRLTTDTILINNNINTNGKNVDCSGGNITAFTINAITFNATSDYRIKDDIKQITYNVDKLKPVQYINKESKKEDIGLIAHELQEICPFLVSGEKDGNEYQSVNYIGIIGILIKEIQDLKKRVDIIEKKG